MAIGIEMGRDITLLGYFGIYFEGKEYSLMGSLMSRELIMDPNNFGILKMYRQWVVWVFILSLFNFLGFNLRGLWWYSYSAIGSWD
jgi:hypothetical protein